MLSRLPLRFAGLTAGVLLGLGCTDDSATTPPPVTLPIADAAPPAPSGTAKILVVDYDLVTTANLYPPLANANVAFYPPGGGAVMETTTDAAGLATFSGIDWSLGKATVVGYAPDRTAYIITSFSPDALARLERGPIDDALYFSLSTKASARPQATLGGMLLNKTDPTNWVTIGSSAGAAQFQNTTATYSLAVPTGTPVSLFATEWKQEMAPAVATFLRWVNVDIPAGATKLDIDLATAPALTPKHVKRTFAIPGGASGSLGGATAYEIVTLSTTSAPLGFQTSRLPSADGASVALEADVLADVPGEVVTYNILTKADGAATYVIEDGAPADGATVSDFASVPAFSFDSVKLGDPLPLTDLLGDESCTADYFDAATGDEIFDLYTVRDDLEATSMTLTSPRKTDLPMAVQAQLGTTALTGQLYCTRKGDLLPISALPKHYVISRQFKSAF